ncbi:hypothetical protein AMTRI_Chr04g187100 [Amborella trichopoda]
MMKFEELVGSTYPTSGVFFPIELGKVQFDHSRKVSSNGPRTAIWKWSHMHLPCVGRFTIFAVVPQLIKTGIDCSKHLLHGVHHFLEASLLICLQAPYLELQMFNALIRHAWLRY